MHRYYFDVIITIIELFTISAYDLEDPNPFKNVIFDQENILNEFIKQTLKVPHKSSVTKDFLDTRQLIEKNNYGYENHTVKTKDGYILSLHRILTENRNATPVLIQHCLLAASDTFLMVQREESLAFLLADAGFDVWLGDVRGNWYSRKHAYFEPTDAKFWDFSFHENAYYDIPAFIDRILEVTGHASLFYIGHSMGTTIFFVMASLKPEYNAKIKGAALLAPIAITTRAKDLPQNVLKLFVQIEDTLYTTLKLASLYEFFPRSSVSITGIQEICRMRNDVCIIFINQLFGDNRNNYNRETIAHDLSYFPVGTSLKTMHHISSFFRTGFHFYDYGEWENLRRYKSKTPPRYELRKVTAPVALYWGANDATVNKSVIAQMAEILPNVIKSYQVPDPKFSHLDFLLGMNRVDVLYNDIIALLSNLDG